MFNRIEILPVETKPYEKGYYIELKMGYGNHGFSLFETNSAKIVEDKLSGKGEHCWSVKVSDAIKLVKLWNKYFPNGFGYGTGLGRTSWDEDSLVEFYKFSKKDAREFCSFISGEVTYPLFKESEYYLNYGIVNIKITYRDENGIHDTKIH